MGTDVRRRYAFDVNALVSAFLFPDSLPGRALESVLVGHDLLMSLELAAEATDVMRREKFDRYIARERREALLAGTIRSSVFIQTSSSISACRDPDDNRILELAVDGNATAIVSGDSDLLVLHPFRGIAILNPHDFVASIGS
jgi:putative PIN family toxin of toxin-antitoxin system